MEESKRTRLRRGVRWLALTLAVGFFAFLVWMGTVLLRVDVTVHTLGSSEGAD